jgi:hypothetical protein
MPSYRLVYSHNDSTQVFRGVPEERVLLAVLAGITPPRGWEGCRVHFGLLATENDTMVHVAIEGPMAAEVRRVLANAFEGLGIPVEQDPVGAPEEQHPLVTVSSGQWVAVES